MNRVMLIIGILEKSKPDPGSSTPENIANWDRIFSQLRAFFQKDGTDVVIKKPFPEILKIMKQILAKNQERLRGALFIIRDGTDEAIIAKTKDSDFGALLGFQLVFGIFCAKQIWPDTELYLAEAKRINDEYIRLYMFVNSGRNFNDLN